MDTYPVEKGTDSNWEREQWHCGAVNPECLLDIIDTRMTVSAEGDRRPCLY